MESLRWRLEAMPWFRETAPEVIIVDNGSGDATWQKAVRWAADASYLTAVKLPRDYGNQVAILSGLSVASGQWVAVLDADLQDPPELLGKMLSDAQRAGGRAAIGVKTVRQDDFFLLEIIKDIAGRAFPFEPGEGDFCVMDRITVRKILQVGEPWVPFRVRRYWALRGERVCRLPYARQARRAGRTKFNLRSLAGSWWRIVRSLYLMGGRTQFPFVAPIETIVRL